MAASTESSILVAAPADVVLDVIADFPAYPQWTEEVTQVEVLSEDADGWAEQVRFRLEAGPVKDTYVLAYRWDVAEDGTGVVSWSLVEGEALRAMDGSYTLAAEGSGTRVTYALTVDLKMPMLGAVKRTAEKRIVAAALEGLKARAEA